MSVRHRHFASTPWLAHAVVMDGDTMALAPIVATPLVVLTRMRPAAPPPLPACQLLT